MIRVSSMGKNNDVTEKENTVVKKLIWIYTELSFAYFKSEMSLDYLQGEWNLKGQKILTNT